MRTLLTSILLVTATLPALSQAQTTNICDRTEGVRDAIFEATQYHDCADVPLAHIETLGVHGGRYGYTIDALQAGDFDGLTGLQTLWLYDNFLTELPDGIFDGLTSLRDLDLSRNRLMSLPDGVFDDLTGLQRLWLNSNDLASLPEGVFDNLTNLTYLGLSENQLTALPPGVFDNLTSLQTLELLANHLVGLARNDPLFARLPSGAVVDLRQQTKAPEQPEQPEEPDTAENVCDRTPELRDAFMQAFGTDDCRTVDSEALASIERLYFFEKGFTTLAAGDFDGLTNLQELNLSSNLLASLPDGVFDDLTNLQGLSLNENQLAGLPGGAFEGLTNLQELALQFNNLRVLPDGAFDGLTSLRELRLTSNDLMRLPDGAFDGLSSLQELYLGNNDLTRLPDGAFDGLTSLRALHLSENQLTALPDGVFDGLTSLLYLYLDNNRLLRLRGGVFDDLTSLRTLLLHNNQLTALPDGLFGNLTSLEALGLAGNSLTALSDGVFDGLTNLLLLGLHDNQLTTLPASVFDDLTSLGLLRLDNNRLTALPDSVFDNLAGLQTLSLQSNQLTALPDGVFDGLTSELHNLNLGDNQLTALPDGMFDGLTGLRTLHLNDNHLVGLTRNDPLFAGLYSGLDLALGGQTEAPGTPEPTTDATRIAAAVPLMLSASDSMGQGFVRIINESEESRMIRILAFDDGGIAANPIEIELGANQVLHFNSNDLEQGNTNKGINAGIGLPSQGDWRLDIESATDLRVLAFVRTNDGFLTVMHDLLPRNADGLLVAQTFNPGSNMTQESRLRLVNTGANAERVSIRGVDDRGNNGGPVTLTLAAGASRTLSAFDLENGTQGLTGTLGDGAGKWRLFITAGQPVVGVSLLRAASGHFTNISTMGVITEEG